MGLLADYLKNEAEHLRTEADKRGEARAEWHYLKEILFPERLSLWIAIRLNRLFFGFYNDGTRSGLGLV